MTKQAQRTAERRRRHIMAGKCPCGRVKVAGKASCEFCLAKTRRWVRKLLARRRQADLCQDCGGPLDCGGSTCRVCRDWRNEKKQMRKRGLRHERFPLGEFWVDWMLVIQGHDGPAEGDPTPEEIAERAAEVRAQWYK